MNNRAIILTQFGGVDATKASTTQFPEAAPGLVVVRLSAAGINGLDWKIREGYLRDAVPTVFPTVLGLELAGEVHAAAPGSRFAVGDRVFGLAAPGNGAYAEYVVVPDMLLAPVPSAVSDQVAAALPVAGLTAWQMLHAAGAPRAGDTILVHGAAGGVGTLLVQMAKQMGLNVIATASTSSRSTCLIWASPPSSTGSPRHSKTGCRPSISSLTLLAPTPRTGPGQWARPASISPPPAPTAVAASPS